MKKYADIDVQFSVVFEDDGETDLATQAYEALDELLGANLSTSEAFMGAEIVGPVRDTEMPGAKS